jgi:hypothetical protein
VYEIDGAEASVDVEKCHRSRASGVIVITGTAGIDEGDAVDFIVEGMMCLPEDDEIDRLPKNIFRLLDPVRIRLDRADIVRDADSVSIQVLNSRIGKGREIQIKVVASDGQDAAVSLAELLQNVLTLDIPGMDHDVTFAQYVHHLWRDLVSTFPVCVGKDSNSHNGVPP